MNRKAIARIVLAAGAVAIFSHPQFASAATTGASDSTALDVNLTVLNLVSVNLALRLASGTAAPAYNLNTTLLSLSAAADLG